MAQRPPANVVNSMRDGEEIDGVQRGAKQYHLMLSDFSRGPLLSVVLFLLLETSYSTANVVTNPCLREQMDHELYIPPNIPPMLSS
jgi:hypothetical protein